MYEDYEIEYTEAEFPEKALISEQLLIDEMEADVKKILLKMTSNPNGNCLNGN